MLQVGFIPAWQGVKIDDTKNTKTGDLGSTGLHEVGFQPAQKANKNCKSADVFTYPSHVFKIFLWNYAG